MTVHASRIELSVVDMKAGGFLSSLFQRSPSQPFIPPHMAVAQDVNFSGCLRLTDSRKVMSTLRDKGVAVQVWGTGISDPS